jgi:nanoRNase/pAp phosphatase (c-di-AMP/oligoRNAs hydrolase)
MGTRMSNRRDLGVRSSDSLLNIVSKFRCCLVVMHDNPDPDAIAAGWAIQILIREMSRIPCRLVGGGALVRAENRHMVDLLSPPVELVDELGNLDATATILVDCSLGASNHLLTREEVQPVAIVDHHMHGNGRTTDVAFFDVRPNVAASASIAASYLREQQLEPGMKLATALVYAIRTETVACEFHFSDLDRSILPWLTERSDPALLAEIESAPLSRAYFGDLVLGIQNTFLYNDVAMCILPRAEGVEIVGEVADLLIRYKGIGRVFCAAASGDDLVVSIRTKRDTDHAAKLLQIVLAGLGGGGGHEHRAGGKVPGVARGGRINEDLENEIRDRWLGACQTDRQRGTRLVARREIVDNL